MLLQETEGRTDEFLVIGQPAAQTQLGQQQALEGAGQGMNLIQLNIFD